MNIQSFYRSPFAPRIHFDESGAGGGAAGGDAGAGGGAKPWHEGLDAEIRGHIDNKGWKVDDPKTVVTEMAKAWKGLEKHFGASADQIIKLPKDPTDEAGWRGVRERLGMPKEAKEYDFSGIKRANGSDLEQSFTDTMRNTLHKAGTSKDAATEVVRSVTKFMDDVETAKATERTAKLETDRNALKGEWGPNWEFNRLTAMQGAKRAVGSDEAAVKVIDAMQDAIGYKATMEFWRKIGAGTTEDTFVEARQGGNPTTMNGAIARKAELEGDPDWSARYLKGSPKEVQEMNNLMAIITGAAA